MAPTIDSASLEHPDSATETAPASFARWLHKSELFVYYPLSILTPPPCFLGNLHFLGINEGKMPHYRPKAEHFTA